MKNQEIEWLLSEKYHGEKTAGFFTDCARLEAGEPLAYVISSIPFLNTTINLDSHPLIPRPETEYWVEQAIATIKTTLSKQDLGFVQNHSSERVHVLDLCAGSGAIGVAVAKAVPEATVTFAELDPAHLPTIKNNLTENTTIYSSIKYPVIESDLFSNVPGTFDFILTNPPYIDAKAHTVEASVTSHEPHLALFGGEAGLAIITRIICEASSYLTPHGQLWIEHEPFQTEAINILATTNGFTSRNHDDQYGTVRYSILTRSMAE